MICSTIWILGYVYNKPSVFYILERTAVQMEDLETSAHESTIVNGSLKRKPGTSNSSSKRSRTSSTCSQSSNPPDSLVASNHSVRADSLASNKPMDAKTGEAVQVTASVVKNAEVALDDVESRHDRPSSSISLRHVT